MATGYLVLVSLDGHRVLVLMCLDGHWVVVMLSWMTTGYLCWCAWIILCSGLRLPQLAVCTGQPLGGGSPCGCCTGHFRATLIVFCDIHLCWPSKVFLSPICSCYTKYFLLAYSMKIVWTCSNWHFSIELYLCICMCICIWWHNTRYPFFLSHGTSSPDPT